MCCSAADFDHETFTDGDQQQPQSTLVGQDAELGHESPFHPPTGRQWVTGEDRCIEVVIAKRGGQLDDD
jgi:hypothetical protein